MNLAYFLVAFSGLGLSLIGLNHYFDLWPQNHVTLDLLISILFVAAQTLVMFFFVGMGVNVKEYLQEHAEADKDLYSRMFGIKRRLYPPTLMVTILFIVMVIMDGLYFLGRVYEWWFHGFYMATIYYYLKATLVQHRSFRESTKIVLEMTGVDLDVSGDS